MMLDIAGQLHTHQAVFPLSWSQLGLTLDHVYAGIVFLA